MRSKIAEEQWHSVYKLDKLLGMYIYSYNMVSDELNNTAVCANDLCKILCSCKSLATLHVTPYNHVIIGNSCLLQHSGIPKNFAGLLDYRSNFRVLKIKYSITIIHNLSYTLL